MSTITYPHVEFRSDGVPVVAGTGFKVRILVEAYLAGATPAQLLADYPQLTLGGIHGALTFYYDHREEIDQEIAEGRRLAERMMAEQGEPFLNKKLRTMSDEELTALYEKLDRPGEGSVFFQTLRAVGRKLP
jgi:uncharacterized protein (DUF433 family)